MKAALLKFLKLYAIAFATFLLIDVYRIRSKNSDDTEVAALLALPAPANQQSQPLDSDQIRLDAGFLT